MFPTNPAIMTHASDGHHHHGQLPSEVNSHHGEQQPQKQLPQPLDAADERAPMALAAANTNAAARADVDLREDLCSPKQRDAAHNDLRRGGADRPDDRRDTAPSLNDDPQQRGLEAAEERRPAAIALSNDATIDSTASTNGSSTTDMSRQQQQPRQQPHRDQQQPVAEQVTRNGPLHSVAAWAHADAGRLGRVFEGLLSKLNAPWQRPIRDGMATWFYVAQGQDPAQWPKHQAVACQRAIDQCHLAAAVMSQEAFDKIFEAYEKQTTPGKVACGPPVVEEAERHTSLTGTSG